ncbi:YjcZ family sporulation protein [Halalkalibacter akibai]|nr:YjcZ family sporulation protein [Halalkalibacter akibai]
MTGVAGAGYGGGFALLVVLFILLVIIGASWGGAGYGAY